jgi:arginine-tRNA-protein transferase
MKQVYFLEDIIDESFPMQQVAPEVFDRLMAMGWRAMGMDFIRHSFSLHRTQLCKTIPLRIALKDYRPRKSHLKLLRRNRHLCVQTAPIEVTPWHKAVFQAHTARFEENAPDNLYLFLSNEARKVPVQGMQISIAEPDCLPFAYSFAHSGARCMSATYCCFLPYAPYTSYSPGIHTMLLEIEKAVEMGLDYYYHGYVYNVPSQFDYKLHFEGLEAYNWKEDVWMALSGL